MSDALNDAIPELVDEILSTAIQRQASDIHMKPHEDRMEVHFRIDGMLVPYQTYEKIYHQPIIMRIKIISGLKTDEQRLPQDGKTSVDFNNEEIDLRISVLPTKFGEKIVVRILKKNPELTSLRDIGFHPNTIIQVEQHLVDTYGMVVTVGPTGSGKTTTLFSMLSYFDGNRYNISTLEDPIEYNIEDVTQTQINANIGFDFSDGLRTLLRQDPDIIMVGEIRDKKTAELAIESALTGHLVFSSLHTNTAASTIQRLINMGIDRYLISEAIRLIISQRLARKLCADCRKPARNIQSKYYDFLKNSTDIDPDNTTFYESGGCEKCNDTGYKGRIGVFEILENSPTITEMIIKNASTAEIEEQAIQEGTMPLQYDACYKASKGDITLTEAIRLTTQ